MTTMSALTAIARWWRNNCPHFWRAGAWTGDAICDSCSTTDGGDGDA